jgi:hypothetical protein
MNNNFHATNVVIGYSPQEVSYFAAAAMSIDFVDIDCSPMIFKALVGLRS